MNYKNLLKIILFSLTINGCKKKELEKDILFSMYVISDTHLLSDSLLSKDNTIYRKEHLTNDGRSQELDASLLNKVIDKCNKERIKYLVITGDLTFNGEIESHQDIVNILSKLEYTQALVIPGNHDLNNQNCYTFINDKQKYIQGLQPEDFSKMYEDFGYNFAFSKDTSSLSYAVDLGCDYIGLFMDFNLTKFNNEFSYNFIGGYAEEDTLEWLEGVLKENREKKFISFSHQNLLVHNEQFVNMYQIQNYKDVLNLYEKYNVRINFSGHLHIQSLKTNKRFTEITNGSLIISNGNVGNVDFYSNGIDYNSFCIEESLKYYFKDNFIRKNYYKLDKEKYNDKSEDIATFLLECGSDYFAGDYDLIRQRVSLNKDLYKLILNNESNKYYLTTINPPKINPRKATIIY